MLPRIVLCLNSIHSPKKIDAKYPWMKNITGLLYSGGDTPAKLFESYKRLNIPLNLFLKSEFSEEKIPDHKTRMDKMKTFISLLPHLDRLKSTSVYEFIDEERDQFIKIF